MRRIVLHVLAAIGGAALLWALYTVVAPEPSDRVPTSLSGDPREVGTDEFAAAVAANLNAPFVDGNRVELLENGDEIFPPMLEAIRSAERSVNFLTYIYWTGDIAREFARALSDAALRGVEVRVLLDAYGAHKMSDDVVAEMERAGCRVAWFHPLHWYNLRRVNNRTHRKVLVVDGKTGFTGGVGIAAEWTGDAGDPDHWRDDHFRFEGPVVRYLQGAFAENWRIATGEMLAGGRMFPPLEPAGDAAAVTVASSPGPGMSDVGLLYWIAISVADRQLDIATPYFVPDPSLLQAITTAARRGVRVRILVPGQYNDSKMVRAASKAYYDDLLEAGAELFEYRPTMMHVKTLVVDDALAVIGSANFDNRSFELNDELVVAVADSGLAAALRRSFDADLERAGAVTLEALSNRSLIERLRTRLAVALREQL